MHLTPPVCICLGCVACRQNITDYPDDVISYILHLLLKMLNLHFHQEKETTNMYPKQDSSWESLAISNVSTISICYINAKANKILASILFTYRDDDQSRHLLRWLITQLQTRNNSEILEALLMSLHVALRRPENRHVFCENGWKANLISIFDIELMFCMWMLTVNN